MRFALNSLAVVAGDWLLAHCQEEWIDRYGHRIEEGRFPRSQADRQAVAEEVAFSRRLCAKHNWPSIDVTRRSIEETAAAVMTLLADRRRQPVSPS